MNTRLRPRQPLPVPGGNTIDRPLHNGAQGRFHGVRHDSGLHDSVDASVDHSVLASTAHTWFARDRRTSRQGDHAEANRRHTPNPGRAALVRSTSGFRGNGKELSDQLRSGLSLPREAAALSSPIGSGSAAATARVRWRASRFSMPGPGERTRSANCAGATEQHSARLRVADHARLGADLRPLADPQVPGERRLPAHLHEIFQHGGSGDPDLRHDHTSSDPGERCGQSAPDCPNASQHRMNVSCTEPRSTVEFAPISTSFSMSHAAKLRHAQEPGRRNGRN